MVYDKLLAKGAAMMDIPMPPPIACKINFSIQL